MSNPRIFISRLASFSKPEKIPDIEAKPKSGLNLNWWININDFVPPPPRPPFLEELVSDGLTTCDLCSWAWETSFHSLEGHEEPSNDFMWIILLIIVSFSSAVVGAFIMVTALKYRRANSVRSFARSCSSKKQDFSTDQLCNQPNETKNTANIDLNFFMEETENEGFYATLNELDHDQDSMNSESENMNTYQKSSFCNKGENNEFVVSAPSSAYYSDLSNPPEKQYESIDNFERSEIIKCVGTSFVTLSNNNVITNRLSAISENNCQNRDVNV